MMIEDDDDDDRGAGQQRRTTTAHRPWLGMVGPEPPHFTAAPTEFYRRRRGLPARAWEAAGTGARHCSLQ
jgi:hypothetical protein